MASISILYQDNSEGLKRKMFVEYLNPALEVMELQASLIRTKDLEGIIKRLAQIEGHCWAELERRHKEENERDMASENEQEVRCPKCNSAKIIPVIYGSASPALCKQESRGEVLLGHHMMINNPPKHYCCDCAQLWREPGSFEFPVQAADGGYYTPSSDELILYKTKTERA